MGANFMNIDLFTHLTQTEMLAAAGVAFLALAGGTATIIIKNKKRHVVRKTEDQVIAEARESLKDKASDAVAENPAESKGLEKTPQESNNPTTRSLGFETRFASASLPTPATKTAKNIISNTHPVPLWSEVENKVPDLPAEDLMSSAFVFDATDDREQATAYLKQAIRVASMDEAARYEIILAHYEDFSNQESLKDIHDRVMHQPAVDVVVALPESKLSPIEVATPVEQDAFSRAIGKESQDTSELIAPEPLPSNLEEASENTTNEFLQQYVQENSVSDDDILLLKAFKEKETNSTQEQTVRSLVSEDKIDASLTVLEQALQKSTTDIKAIQDNTFGSPELENFMHGLAQEAHAQDKEIEQANAEDERKVQMMLEEQSPEEKPLIFSTMKLAVQDNFNDTFSKQKALEGAFHSVDNEKHEVWVNWAQRHGEETSFYKDFFNLSYPWGTKEAMLELDEQLQAKSHYQGNYAIVSVFETKKH